MEKYIYKIQNLINGKCYIGQTVDYKRRFLEHKGKYQEGSCKALYSAFDKYGIDNFSFEIIDFGSNYNELEMYYIEKYDSFKNGYNMTKGGDNPPINKGENSPFLSHEIETVDTVKHLLKNTKMQLKEIAEQTGYDYSTIKRINRGVIWKEDGEEYPLRVSKIPFTETQVKEIVDMLLDSRFTHKEIAEKFGVARTTITAINKGKNYRLDGYDYPLREFRVG